MVLSRTDCIHENIIKEFYLFNNNHKHADCLVIKNKQTVNISKFFPFQIIVYSIVIKMSNCVLCLSAETSERNKLFTCNQCLMIVHQYCYDIPENISSENYICNFCENHNKNSEQNCFLCPCKTKALKRTTCGRWVEKKTKKQKCYHCKKSKGVIKCNEKGCRKYIHAPCALSVDCLYEHEKIFHVYCDKHIKKYVSILL